MAACGALLSLLNTIYLITKHPRISSSLDSEQIESLRQKADSLLDFIDKYGYRGGGSEEEYDLERRIASAAYEAEDAIDSHIVDQFAAERSGCLLPGLQRIMEDMDSLEERVARAKAERGIEDQQPAHSSVRVTSVRSQTRMVGFEEERIQIMDILTGHQSSLQIVSVTGMGGAGKSTLVRNVYDSSLIVEHFYVRAWTSISQQYSVEEILTHILSSIKNPASGTEELGERLYKSLWGRRYLIVLDDIWNIEVWDKIKFFFPNNNNGSRIVLTTRLSNLANQISFVNFRLGFLDEGKSWTLFCETVFGCEDCPPELKNVGKEISDLCRGLPLSLVVIGGLLRRSDMSVEYWRNIAKNMNSALRLEESGYCSRILSLSYNQLGIHLKLCFLYMGFFREDVEIRASQIIRLWVAEGFIKPDGAQALEEIAEEYLNDLVDRNLILVGKRRYNGKIRS